MLSKSAPTTPHMLLQLGSVAVSDAPFIRALHGLLYGAAKGPHAGYTRFFGYALGSTFKERLHGRLHGDFSGVEASLGLHLI